MSFPRKLENQSRDLQFLHKKVNHLQSSVAYCPKKIEDRGEIKVEKRADDETSPKKINTSNKVSLTQENLNMLSM